VGLRPGESLVSLALRHGLGVASAHRAMADCDLLVRLFTRAREMGADLQEMVALGLRERAKFAAAVPRERNGELKAAGFRWDPDRRVWWREMAVEDAAALPFPTRRIGDPVSEVPEVAVDFEAVRRRAAELLARAVGSAHGRG
jgi:DNA polymerase-3 subunit epsilon